ncbi:MAG: transketolase, partial [Candidatus Shapirobacteria bacterium]
KYQLSNLINIVDCNDYQIDGSVKDIMPLNNLAAKYVQFGWTVTTIDGHNFNQIIKALKQAKKSTFPNCIIAKTILGKGVSFMKNNFKYHDVKNIPEDIYLKAKKELEKNNVKK